MNQPAEGAAASLDAVVDQFTAGMPAVQPYIADKIGDNPEVKPAEAQPEAQPASQAIEKPQGQPAPAQPKDKKGIVFNPKYHLTDKNGDPVKKLDGSFRLKPGLGSPKAKVKAGAVVNQTQGVTPTPAIKTADSIAAEKAAAAQAAAQAAQKAAEAQACARIAVETSLTLCVMGLGDEWQPSSETEKEALVQATGRYFETKGIDDIPPGVALTIVALSYAMPRLTKPKTRNRLQEIRVGLASWWYRLRNKGARKPAENKQEKPDKAEIAA